MLKSSTINVHSAMKHYNHYNGVKDLPSPIAGDVVEVWIDEFRRVLVIPVANGSYIISMDIYYDKWKLKTDEELSVNGGKLVYHKVNVKEFDVKEFNDVIEKMEIIGLNVNDVWETISVRVWVSKIPMENVEDFVKKLYVRIKENLDSIYSRE